MTKKETTDLIDRVREDYFLPAIKVKEREIYDLRLQIKELQYENDALRRTIDRVIEKCATNKITVEFNNE